LVIITKGFSENNLHAILKHAKSCINNRVYVSIKGFSPYDGDWKYNIENCYSMANKICPDLDVRLLLPYAKNNLNHRDISVVLCDDINMKFDAIKQYAAHVITKIPDAYLNIEGEGESIIEVPKHFDSKFAHVCLGGTFDRLHNGHKILLSMSALLTNKMLFCGVSGDELIKNKVLCELIEPLSTRIENCVSFLQDIKPDVMYTVDQINHPFGPIVDNPDFDCIVGSMETELGCKEINANRLKKGYKLLNVELIQMIDDELGEGASEIKVSSSKNRMKLLGRLLKPPNKPHVSGKCFIIGLTGGIASGKSSIANKLKTFGAEVIDCDKLGHEAYTPGTDCFSKIVSQFGNQVVNAENGMINRAVLGSIVFQNPKEMAKLTDIVWPAISELVQAKIRNIENSKDGNRIVVVDAAVLLDAGWQHLCNEVWVSFIPRTEAIERLKNRNKLNVTEAVARIDSQKPNKDYLAIANVVFSTFWSYDFTHQQLKEAWDNLQCRLKENKQF